MKHRLKIALFLLLKISTLMAEVPNNYSKIYFYGTISNANDKAAINLTQNLFYSQFEALNSFTIIDNRLIPFSSAVQLSDIDPSFYVEIQIADSKWLCSLHLVTTQYDKVYTRTYDSYYKILMDGKNLIENLLSSKNQIVEDENILSENNAEETFKINMDFLAGTWHGEEHIDKIVLLRSGRGFIIYKNGASMNIQISISGDTVLATQTSKSNASFYPELPREIALVAAASASPIVWELSLISESQLAGTKTTLVPVVTDGKAISSENSKVTVIWSR
jgi:hypothetical protein